MSIDRASARLAAERVLGSEAVADDLARHRGRLTEPVQVHAPTGGPGGWIVGVEMEDRLLGLIQLRSDGRFRRYVSFHAQYGSADACPRTEAWLDPAVIAERAREVADPGDELGEPTLTYDRNPDRIIWEVPVTSAAGPKTIQVIGDHASVTSRGTNAV